MGDSPQPTVPSAKTDENAIDPATLPPLESLGPDSDYTVFLRKGVPEALRTAALRRAWFTDPAIRDFPSPAVDYAWDFNAPEFALRPTDDVKKMLDQIFARRPVEAAETPVAAAQGATPTEAPAAGQESRGDLSLPQKRATSGPEPSETHNTPRETSQPRPKHGGALPD